MSRPAVDLAITPTLPSEVPARNSLDTPAVETKVELDNNDEKRNSIDHAALLAETVQRRLTLRQTVKKYPIVTLLAMGAAFSAVSDGYHLSMGSIVGLSGFINQFGSPGPTGA